MWEWACVYLCESVQVCESVHVCMHGSVCQLCVCVCDMLKEQPGKIVLKFITLQ